MPSRHIRFRIAHADALFFVAVLLVPTFPAAAQQKQETGPDQAAEQQFRQLCTGCHGDGGAGGDRAPGLVNSRSLRQRSESQIRDLIRSGTPGGMPAFPLPENQLRALAQYVHSFNASAHDSKPAGNIAVGRQFFFAKGGCGSCHMIHGQGTANGPDLSDIGRQLTVSELNQVLDNPTASMGSRSSADCPGWAFCPQEPWGVVNVKLKNGQSLRGFARNQGMHDLVLQTFDGRIHSLTETQYQNISREKTSLMPPLNASPEERRNLIAYLSSLAGVPTGPLTVDPEPARANTVEAILHPKSGEWPTFNGSLSANRHSPLRQIDTHNVTRLRLQWTYSLPHTGLETTPLVSNGVMYVTGPDRVCAIASLTGLEIWCYTRSRTTDESARPSASREPNRGVALLGDRVFFAGSDAHLVCLNRLTGGVMWDVSMPETPGRYSATSAPLVAGDLVISGIAGGDTPLRGFVAAYEVSTGRQVWRFWTVPKPGEPGSETWTGDAIATGGGATWVTGSYDVETETLFWATGNPFPATDGGERAGVNLYTNCVLALDVKTGKLRWYFQFTPHDLHDWDATEPLVLVDAPFRGRARKLLLQANRSGYFYVLDRTNGELLVGKPFVKKLTWSSGIGPDGRPQVLESNQPTKAGIKTCPAVRGATNWYSTAFSPETRLFYIMAVEDCSVYRQAHNGGYEGYRDPSDPGSKYLRALDIESGKIVWEIPQVGTPESNYSGVLTTAGGLLFYGETGGSFAALDATNGRTLWHFNTGAQWKASPMTYMANGKQYVAIAAGSNILSFALEGD